MHQPALYLFFQPVDHRAEAVEGLDYLPSSELDLENVPNVRSRWIVLYLAGLKCWI